MEDEFLIDKLVDETLDDESIYSEHVRDQLLEDDEIWYNGIPPILIGGMSSAQKPPIISGILSIKNNIR